MFFLTKTSKRRLVDRLEAVENDVKNLREDFVDLQERTTRRYARILKQVERQNGASVDPRLATVDRPTSPPTDPVSEMLLKRRIRSGTKLPTEEEV